MHIGQSHTSYIDFRLFFEFMIGLSFFRCVVVLFVMLLLLFVSLSLRGKLLILLCFEGRGRDVDAQIL